jgi:D-lactate dehydrogenase (cytochrome)
MMIRSGLGLCFRAATGRQSTRTASGTRYCSTSPAFNNIRQSSTQARQRGSTVSSRRLVSSSSGSSSQSVSSFSLTTLLTIVGGLVGYHLASEFDNYISGRPVFTFTTNSDSDDYFTKPKFGSPQDFHKAIEELRKAFPAEDTVTTDPEDLHDHGFSVNDYLPGE